MQITDLAISVLSLSTLEAYVKRNVVIKNTPVHPIPSSNPDIKTSLFIGLLGEGYIITATTETHLLQSDKNGDWFYCNFTFCPPCLISPGSHELYMV